MYPDFVSFSPKNDYFLIIKIMIEWKLFQALKYVTNCCKTSIKRMSKSCGSVSVRWMKEAYFAKLLSFSFSINAKIRLVLFSKQTSYFKASKFWGMVRK